MQRPGIGKADFEDHAVGQVRVDVTPAGRDLADRREQQRRVAVLGRITRRPTFKARAAICASSCIDSTRIAGGLFNARMRAIASRPLTPGIEMSSNTTSHGTWRKVSSSCSPLLASPTTSRSLARPINCLIPSRTMVWSSATSTRITRTSSWCYASNGTVTLRVVPSPVRCPGAVARP